MFKFEITSLYEQADAIRGGIMRDKQYSSLHKACNVEIYGGKASMLSSLLNKGLSSVVDGYVLSVNTFRSFLLDSGLSEDTIKLAIKYDEQAIEDILNVIYYAKWGKLLMDELGELFNLIKKPLCVRSSAVLEDGANRSYSGIYSSSVNIQSLGEFLGAIRQTWASAFSPNAVLYSKRIGSELSMMAVCIQPQINSLSAGVAFYENGRLSVSAAYGHGIGVVSGKVPCDNYFWDNPTAKPVIRLASKEFCHIPNESNSSIVMHYIDQKWRKKDSVLLFVLGAYERNSILNCEIKSCFDKDLRNEPALNDEERERLSRYIYQNLIPALGDRNWDIEWAIDHDGAIYILQARPLTAAFANNQNDSVSAYSGLDFNREHIKGVSISSGIGIGKLRFVTKESYTQVKSGEIAAMNFIEDEYLGVLDKVDALIIGDGSILSHCAIIAREWQIPCVGGIHKKDLTEGFTYTVNGNTGQVSVAGKSGDLSLSSTYSDYTPHEAGFSILPWLSAAVCTVYAQPHKKKFLLNELISQIDGLPNGCFVDFSGVDQLTTENEKYNQALREMFDLAFNYYKG